VPIVYLDSSAIVKRYIDEPGSKVIRDLYLKAYEREVRLAYSIWNIGEVLGVFDRARRLDRINEEEYDIVRRRFLGESKRMMKLDIVVILPVKVKTLKEAWRLVEKHHIYIADSLQISSAKYINSEEFFTSDEKLHKAALAEGLDSIILV